MFRSNALFTSLLFSLLYLVSAFFDKQPSKKEADLCFCQLKGQIDDCSCNVDTVDYFNNMKIYPRLKSILTKDYFRFYKVNLKKTCPFWADDSKCAIRFCHVEACSEQDIPEGLKGSDNPSHSSDVLLRYTDTTHEDCKGDIDSDLGFLNTTISADTYEEFKLWTLYDNTQDNYCTYYDEDDEAEYVDLLLNPERYTGYKGRSAHRVWHSIYMENCFRPDNSYGAYIQSSKLNGMCLEKRVFYRVISGLHASINIHLCSNYLLSEKSLSLSKTGAGWGPNPVEFQRRFDPSLTNDEGPQWLKNLYFLYLLELRAMNKAAPYLRSEHYYTGNKEEDDEVKMAINNLLTVLSKFPDMFNETSMFNGGQDARELKDQFRLHFRNISEIMDCVGCDKCKLWGKLQIQGLGTALKILFSGKFDTLPDGDVDVRRMKRRNFNLTRGEIVSLVNAFGRLSTSIFELDEFRKSTESVNR